MLFMMFKFPINMNPFLRELVINPTDVCIYHVSVSAGRASACDLCRDTASQWIAALTSCICSAMPTLEEWLLAMRRGWSRLVAALV
jgi:hypothetical protein